MINLAEINQEVARELEAHCPGQVVWVNTPQGALPTIVNTAVSPDWLVVGTANS